MKFQKEGGKTYFIIRRSDYGRSFKSIEELYNEAISDFGSLDKSRMEIMYYGGNRYKRTYGIEFAINDSVIPIDYVEVENIEYVF